MDAEVSVAVGFVTAGAVTIASTPAAIAIARRTDFYDHPREYRKHASATPLLGGAAVLVGFLIAAVAVGGVSGKHVLILCAIGMWVLGTIDDRFAVSPKWRLLAELLAAAALVSSGLGWKTSGGSVFDFVLTVAWVVGLVNAFNLMDNLDGACSTVGSVCAAGIGTLAAIHGLTALAGLSFALAGACAGFLPWNLAGPAKIFLGDGGSMLIGFMVATLSMATARQLNAGDANILTGALLAGLPILDTALVSLSRTRRGVSLLTGGRDHLTHRLLLSAHSARLVALVLASLQASLCGLAIVGDRTDTAILVGLSLMAVTIGAAAIVALDTARWRPAGIAIASHLGTSRGRSVGVDPG
jgi:UDP-GlcNAc:undecaprenyl-phosphate/decaprenyl-phosphate GlcNAc-1-phosphate transferase